MIYIGQVIDVYTDKVRMTLFGQFKYVKSAVTYVSFEDNKQAGYRKYLTVVTPLWKYVLKKIVRFFKLEKEEVDIQDLKRQETYREIRSKRLQSKRNSQIT